MFNVSYFTEEECLKEYERWLASELVDEETKKELKEIGEIGTKEEQNRKIKRCFRSFLVFGTAGLRGIMGPGINNINIYTIMHATQAFADYINSMSISIEERKIVIGYDTRLNSKLYAEIAAQVMAANKIHVFLFKDIRPTPEVSFAIRELKCIAGINVTASHNPKNYNGYKVYGEDGAQLLEVAADKVRANMSKTDILTGIKKMDFEEAIKENKIEYIEKSIDGKFLDVIFKQLAPSEKMKEMLSRLNLTFTPIHGAGYLMIPNILKKSGVKEENLHVVKEQCYPDGTFPSIWFPNPELPSSYQLALKLASKTQDDFIIISDPDADRIGMVIRNPNGWYTRLTGNQIGALLLDYIIKNVAMDRINLNSYVIKTFVTTDLINKICEVNNINLFTVYTGFKYIAEIIKEHEKTDLAGDNYIFGFEESLGFLPGVFARDKDSVSSSLLICQMAAYYKEKGMNMYDAMQNLYNVYGCFYDETIDHYMLDDAELTGEQKRDILMNKLRDNPPKIFGNEKVVRYIDFYEKKNTENPEPGITNVLTGEKTWTGQKEDSNMLIFETENKHRVCIRPSGTEPKIKVYFLMNGGYNNYNMEQLKEKTRLFKKTALEFEMITVEYMNDYVYELPKTDMEFEKFNSHIRSLMQYM